MRRRHDTGNGNTGNGGATRRPSAPAQRDGTGASALVLFGATGDLAQTLLFPALYRLEERGNLQIPILGVGRSDWDDAQLHQRIGESVHGALGDIDRAVLERLDRRSHFLRGDYDEGSTYAGVRRCLGAPAAEHAAYYLAIPPALFTTVSDGLGGAGLNRNSRLVVEKPFGHDSASAAALSTELGRTFPPRTDPSRRSLPRQGRSRRPVGAALFQSLPRPAPQSSARALGPDHLRRDHGRRRARRLLRRRRGAA